jgi:hypothetical protein
MSFRRRSSLQFGRQPTKSGSKKTMTDEEPKLCWRQVFDCFTTTERQGRRNHANQNNHNGAYADKRGLWMLRNQPVETFQTM